MSVEAAERNGYTDVTVLANMVCGIYPFMYTWGVLIGIDETGYKGRFCFDSLNAAQSFLRNWNGVDLPTVGEDGCTAIKVPRRYRYGSTLIGFEQ